MKAIKCMNKEIMHAMLMACFAFIGLTSSSRLHGCQPLRPRGSAMLLHRRYLVPDLPHLRGGKREASDSEEVGKPIAVKMKKRSYKHMTVFEDEQGSESSSDLASKRHRKLSRVSQKRSTALDKVFKDKMEKAVVEVEHQKLQIDPRNLCVFDPWTELGEYPQENVEQYEQLLESKAKNAINVLVQHLQSLPPVVEHLKNNETQLHVSLPKPKELLPSVYEIVKKKQTKWERFAQAKGIKKRKKTRAERMETMRLKRAKLHEIGPDGKPIPIEETLRKLQDKKKREKRRRMREIKNFNVKKRKRGLKPGYEKGDVKRTGTRGKVPLKRSFKRQSARRRKSGR
ncbi:hypothetical protein GUITHDRAFT_114517 [Guillardia theta CCMP2712]|uniref:Ribosome biogenesis regulatory protein n=1 Tax=Guillardia theta (strain CCMP2712) TaxID=905079 RepID=L1IU21_GUITC|nr:hypothetical protein GUITHDRAFT_114517 [Guillardia theta CCMP2712]EKX39315.1 hypothetical protein GUITHDRAFT_114517 [Guillardia theta CCMP2712]|eukprot:XP_005826295.1 hypothetical protein GUITHDRAFT_114517 [Guillardia theta CCMP2712]